MKKLLALILALVLLFVLTACGETAEQDAPASEPTPAPTPAPTPEQTPDPTPEPSFLDRMTLGEKLLNEAESSRLSFQAQITLSISDALGELEALIDMNGAVDQTRNPRIQKTELNISLDLGDEPEKRQILLYTEDTDGGLRHYLSYDGGQSWTMLGADAAEPDEASPFAVFLDHAELFEPFGLTSRDGRELILYRAELPAELFAGLSDSLGSLLGLPAQELAGAFGPMPVTVAFETDSGLVAWFEIDGSSLIDALLDRILGAGAEARVGISGAVVRFELSDYNALAPIEIPEAARSAHSPAPAPEAEAAAPGPGTLEGRVYRSEYMGLRFSLPEGWTALDRATIAAQVGLGDDYAGLGFDEALDAHIVYYELWATDGADAVQIMIEKPPIPSLSGISSDTPAAYMEANRDTISAVYGSMGISVTGSERSAETLCGRDYETLLLTAEASGVTLVQKMMTTEKDGLFFTVSLTCVNGDQIDALLALFAAEP